MCSEVQALKLNPCQGLGFRVLDFPKISDTCFEGPNDKDYGILGLNWGLFTLGKTTFFCFARSSHYVKHDAPPLGVAVVLPSHPPASEQLIIPSPQNNSHS